MPPNSQNNRTGMTRHASKWSRKIIKLKIKYNQNKK
jgi:hypothetical protein